MSEPLPTVAEWFEDFGRRAAAGIIAKREWVEAHPGATPAEYAAAILKIMREFGL